MYTGNRAAAEIKDIPSARLIKWIQRSKELEAGYTPDFMSTYWHSAGMGVETGGGDVRSKVLRVVATQTPSGVDGSLGTLC